MKVLAIEREGPRADRASSAALLREEADAVYGLQQSGVVRETWFRADRDEAVLTLECADEAEARAVLASLPLVREGLIAFETIPLRPYPGFGRLFGR